MLEKPESEEVEQSGELEELEGSKGSKELEESKKLDFPGELKSGRNRRSRKSRRNLTTPIPSY